MLSSHNESVIDLLSTPSPLLKHVSSVANPFISDQLPSVLLAWHNRPNNAKLISIGLDMYAMTGEDYETGRSFMTVTGKTELIDSRITNKLVQFATDLECATMLFLSRNSADAISRQVNTPVIIMPDSNCDYIYSTVEQAALLGSKFQQRRRNNKLFEKLYRNRWSLRIETGQDSLHDKEVIDLFQDWNSFGTEGSSDNSAEVKAFQIFSHNESIRRFAELITVKIYVDNFLVGFTVLEKSGHRAVNCHFQKCNLNISYSSDYLFWATCKYLAAEGIHYFNFQEDADIIGLARFKKRLKPVEIVSKFQIEL